MADIFISYARPDRAKVERLGEFLETAGYSVWWDRQIEGGEDFYAAIERELTSAKVVIVAWSEHSTKSRWVKDEAGEAADNNKIITIDFDGSEPPIGFKQFHTLDFTRRNKNSHDELLRAIRLKIEDPSQPETALPRTKNKTLKKSRLLFPAALGAVLLGGVIMFTGTRGEGAISIPFLNSAAKADQPIPEKSIAVLPFADMSLAGDQDYFSDGIAEEILNALVRVPELKVAGRTSSFHFKNQNIDLREIGAALDVAHVLEGSVRTYGKNVRITAQLIRTEDGYHLWSQTYDGKLEDVFDLQENISRAIADELQVILKDQEDENLVVGRTDNSDAYDYYLQGRNLSLSSFKAPDLLRARSLLEKAVEFDPDFALAWSELVRVNGQISAYNGLADQAQIQINVKEAAEQALRADPDLAMAQLAMQRHKRYTNQLADATRFALSAFDSEPENAEINGVVGDQFAYVGRTQASIAYLERASELDPMRTDPWIFLSINRQILGDLDGSDRAARRALELSNVSGYSVLADNAFLRGDPEKAMQYFMDLHAVVKPQVPEDLRAAHLWEAAARAYYQDSDADMEALRTLIKLSLQTERPMINAFNLVLMARTGMIEEMFDNWDKVGSGNSTLGTLIWGNSDWAKAIRDHAEFPEFVREMGFLAEWQAHGYPDICRPLDDDNFECD